MFCKLIVYIGILKLLFIKNLSARHLVALLQRIRELLGIIHRKRLITAD